MTAVSISDQLPFLGGRTDSVSPVSRSTTTRSPRVQLAADRRRTPSDRWRSRRRRAATCSRLRRPTMRTTPIWPISPSAPPRTRRCRTPAACLTVSPRPAPPAPASARPPSRPEHHPGPEPRDRQHGPDRHHGHAEPAGDPVGGIVGLDHRHQRSDDQQYQAERGHRLIVRLVTCGLYASGHRIVLHARLVSWYLSVFACAHAIIPSGAHAIGAEQSAFVRRQTRTANPDTEVGTMTNEEIHQLAQRLRIDSIRAADAASVRAPDVVDVGGRSDGRADGPSPALRL